MTRDKLSLIYLTLSFGLLISGLVYGSSQLLAYFRTGADLNDIILIDTKSVNDYYQPSIEWMPLQNEGRVMERASLAKVSRDYIASYYHQNYALKTGLTVGLNDYFTEKPKVHFTQVVEEQQSTNTSISSTTISHRPTLDFYSEDGTLIALTDRVVSYTQINRSESKTFSFYDTATFQVMLLLEDNFWRIRHKVRTDEATSQTEVSSNAIPKTSHVSQIDSMRIKGINYYPQDNPWIKMWESFNLEIIQSDFQKIAASGFNTIRIFIPYDHFGRASVLQPDLENLTALMDAAQSENLKVIITLFDFFLGYAVEEWSISDRHAEQLVIHIKNHPALLAWDVKNEPDLDFDSMGEEVVSEWLKFMLQRIRGYDPNTPLTIGWSSPKEIESLISYVDFCSFHYYQDPADLKLLLDSLHVDKPLFIGETGSHTFNTWWYPFKRDEADQLNYLKGITEVIDSYDLHYAFWTLYDFKNIPSNVSGKWPWKKGPQKKYGFVRSDETNKPAYDWIQDFNLNVDEK